MTPLERQGELAHQGRETGLKAQRPAQRLLGPLGPSVVPQLCLALRLLSVMGLGLHAVTGGRGVRGSSVYAL